MDLAAALATIEDEPSRADLLPILVAALVIAAVATPSEGLSVLAMLAALAVGSVVLKRQRAREARRALRTGDAVAAFLQVEHDLRVCEPVRVHLRGAEVDVVDADGVERSAEVRWTAVGGRAGRPPVAIVGPVQVLVRALAPA